MSLLRLIYLGLAIWGAVHPMYWFVQWFRAEGWDIMAMVDAWHANMATTGLVWDLTIAAVALTIFVLSEVAVRRNWVALLAIPATFCIGVSCGLPLYLFLRSRPIRQDGALLPVVHPWRARGRGIWTKMKQGRRRDVPQARRCLLVSTAFAPKWKQSGPILAIFVGQDALNSLPRAGDWRMSVTAIETDTKALLEPPKLESAPQAEKIVRVAREHGVNPLRQWREMTQLWFSKAKVQSTDYYNLGLFDPEMPMEVKKQFVGTNGSARLNRELTPPELPPARRFVSNKLMFSALIGQLGFRTTQTQAVISTRSRFGSIPTLDTPEALRRFLRDEARYPLFGKPTNYSGSFGSALIDRREGDEIVLGDGRRLELDAFCREILAEYAEGYLLQTAVVQHRAMSDMVGRAVGTVRIVTIRDAAMPRPLYALWKIPSPKAMSDNFWQDGSMIAPVDMATGEVGEAWIGTGLDARRIERHPVSGRTFQGFPMPHWEAAREMTAEAHALFPEFGVIGWDVAFTEEGPLLIECNDNPFHTLYQMANRKGIRNPEIAPVLERTVARSQAMMAESRAAAKRRTDKRRT